MSESDMKIFILIGTRPNFIKVTQFKKIAKLNYPEMDVQIIHTGQHYDAKMADIFFEQFELIPDHYLNIAPATPNLQIAEIIMKLEALIGKIGKPDWLIVPGDVNSTLAGALYANKAEIKLAHLESGLRSFDKTMPEEHNRVLTDMITDAFFITEPSGLKHLRSEGKSESSMYMVGNTMIDTMVAFEEKIDASSILNKWQLSEKQYVLMTMHRPATVDDKAELQKLIDLINHITQQYKIVFPIHPRTLKNAERFNMLEAFTENKNLILSDPLDYFAFQKLIKYSKFIVTDSGGIQEESTFRQIPCITLRPNTERPITVDIGSNTLLPFDLDQLKTLILSIESGTYKKGQIPELWDGRATERILKILTQSF
jgi:UDP-N-acetylglucosamine 2-epimerase (non-hydrolysing)